MTDEERSEALSQQIKAAREHLIALYNERVKIETSEWVDHLIQAVDAYQNTLASEAIGSLREAELYAEIKRLREGAWSKRQAIIVP